MNALIAIISVFPLFIETFTSTSLAFDQIQAAELPTPCIRTFIDCHYTGALPPEGSAMTLIDIEQNKEALEKWVKEQENPKPGDPIQTGRPENTKSGAGATTPTAPTEARLPPQPVPAFERATGTVGAINGGAPRPGFGGGIGEGPIGENPMLFIVNGWATTHTITANQTGQ